MTVCIAAMSDGPYIFCVADRMLTVGDAQYEGACKISQLSNSIVIMPSGDFGVHSILIPKLREQMREWFIANPGVWPSVADFADRYAMLYREYRREQAYRAVLYPLGIERNGLPSSGFSESVINNILNKYIQHRTPSIEAIFAGMDLGGSHILTVFNDEVQSHDLYGYATIGEGGRHAQTQFMMAKHSPLSASHGVVWLSYLAKKRSEISPSVGGSATDIIVIGQALGNITFLNPEIFRELESQFRNISKAEARVQAKVLQNLDNFVGEIGRKRAEVQLELQVPHTETGPTIPPDSDSPSTPDDAEESRTQADEGEPSKSDDAKPN